MIPFGYWLAAAARLAAACAAALVLTASSCTNPFGTNDIHGSRYTPQISALAVLPNTSIWCDRDFTLSFDFHDPQNDIDKIIFRLLGETSDSIYEESIDWTSDERIVLEPDPDDPTTGSADLTMKINCGLSLPAGQYVLSVQVEDSKNHRSNELTAAVWIF